MDMVRLKINFRLLSIFRVDAVKSVCDAGTQTDEKSIVLGAKARYLIIYVK